MEEGIVFDWNGADGERDRPSVQGLESNDETFLDGARAPSVESPHPGLSNVRKWLPAHDPGEEEKGPAQRILDAAKTSDLSLSAPEMMALVQAP